jgi:putative methionine-R-sulfoxide reductase with GAF domain
MNKKTILEFLKRKRQYHGIMSIDSQTINRMKEHDKKFDHLDYVIKLIEKEINE